jgi:hypothetical protein
VGRTLPTGLEEERAMQGAIEQKTVVPTPGPDDADSWDGGDDEMPDLHDDGFPFLTTIP